MKLTNELIAEKVMQWKVIAYLNGVKDIELPNGEVRKLGSVGNYYDFLNDMNAAMMVVEKMRETHVYEVDEMPPNREYNVEFHLRDSDRDYEGVAYSESLPIAICTAALKAMEAS